MGKRRWKRKPKGEAVVANGPLGKWAALFTFRGNRVFQLAPLGPKVAASNPEELAAETERALRGGFKGPSS
jgi:hypothetical protein